MVIIFPSENVQDSSSENNVVSFVSEKYSVIMTYWVPLNQQLCINVGV